MKKLFITIIITGLISFLFGNYIFNVYLKNKNFGGDNLGHESGFIIEYYEKYDKIILL